MNEKVTWSVLLPKIKNAADFLREFGDLVARLGGTACEVGERDTSDAEAVLLSLQLEMSRDGYQRHIAEIVEWAEAQGAQVGPGPV